MAELLDITKDSVVDFADTNIMKSKYASFLNTKPVLFVTFRSVKGDNKENFIANYVDVLYDLYHQHRSLFPDESMLDKATRIKLIKKYI